MECNKEEAIRAKEIAEKKMQNGDFVGARRIGIKAQQLCPDLDNISQLLTVCEVHCSAQNKLNGSEMDWYGILQIERFTDESVVKRQFRKLALLLHPDKNKFAGAEAAFKLIGEANRVLTDPTKRTIYDIKCRGASRSVTAKAATDQSNQNSFAKKQHAAANKFSNPSHSQYSGPHAYQQSQQRTFWTCCPSCNMRYQYYREFQKKMLRCQNCQQPFMAHDLGIPPGSSWSQFLNEKRVPNQGPSKCVPQNNSAKPSGTSFSHRFPESTAMPKVGKAADVDGSFQSKVVNMGTAAGTGGDSKAQERVNGHVDVKAGNRGDAVSTPEVTKTKGLGTLRSASDKRSKKMAKESSENFNKGKNSSSEGNVGSKQNGPDLSAHNFAPGDDNPSRRSSRKKQHISYGENLCGGGGDDDFDVPPPKRSKGNSSPSVTTEEIKEASVRSRLSEADTFAGFANSVLKGDSKEGKRKASSAHEDAPSSTKRKTGDGKAEEEAVSVSKKAGIKLEDGGEKSKINIDGLNSSEALQAEVFICPDPDFSNFERERAENSFAVNQVWAIYDSLDGMPRFYARIRRVITPAFKLQITWLEGSPNNEAEQNWCDSDLPIACGRYQNGDMIETEDRLMFSHQMRGVNGGRGVCFIYPKKGETWALFKDWNMEWNSEPEKHQPPFEFEFVEILTDFSEDLGIGVAYLGRVKGFVSIFQRVCCNEVISFRIKPSELYRFSHRIPSFKMTGKEGEGVPAGSYELDTAALPSTFGNLVDANVICSSKNLGSGAENGTTALGRSPRESIGPCKGANDTGVSQQAKEQDSVGVASHGKPTQPEGLFGFQANEKLSTHEKKENKSVADASTPRRSARDLSKQSSQLNDAVVGQQAKEDDGNKASHTQPEGLGGFQANEKLSTPKKQKNRFTADSLTPRRSPRDLSKRSSQLNASQCTAEGISGRAAINKDDAGVGQQAKEEDGYNVASHDKPAQPEGKIGFQANEKLSSQKKLEKNKSAVDVFTPRRSPRDLSKRSSQINVGLSTGEDTKEHAASIKDDGHGELGISSCQPVDEMHLHVKDGSLGSPREGRKSTGNRVIEIAPYDFKKEKSEDKFQVNQIWALQSDNDGLPRNYAQVKKIESAVGFELHVAVLEAISLHDDKKQLASCGTFKIKNGKAKVCSASAFSHQVKAKMVGKNTYEIYPRQGEVWAVYKRKAELTGECDIVEVIEENDCGVQVVVLKRLKGMALFFMVPKNLERSSVDIPRADFARFSHQCLAYLHERESDSSMKGIWQLDPSSIPGSVILVD